MNEYFAGSGSLFFLYLFFGSVGSQIHPLKAQRSNACFQERESAFPGNSTHHSIDQFAMGADLSNVENPASPWDKNTFFDFESNLYQCIYHKAEKNDSKQEENNDLHKKSIPEL
ncbi:MAG: hypothetical protein U5K69_23525 [Balneolaceae bacterium]|nr:hypothetical protein [Balneolaceae bacterium]